MRKVVVFLLGALIAALVTPALAQDDDFAVSSVTAGGLFELPDSARDSDNGYGVHLSMATPLSGRVGEGLETDLYGSRRKRQDGGTDSQIGLFVNYGKTFSSIGWNESAYLPSFSPYVLMGVGAVRDDVRGEDTIVPAVDAGLGIGIPLGRRGMALRTEVKLIGQFNDESEPDEEFLLDWQFRLGLQVPLGLAPEPFDPGPGSECGVAVVDLQAGRQDCKVDSDRDGTVDVADLCAGTPPGTPVDGTGCPVSAAFDTDGDGVTDDIDICPGTALGLPVDTNGCTGVPVALAATPAAESASAAAPPLVLKNLRFKKNSAELSEAMRAQLDEAAQSLGSQAELIVEVAGHTDSLGKSDYNLALSLLRANNVRQYLVGRGISRYRLIVEGYGDARPLASNETAEGRAQNRRVDLEPIGIDVIER